MDLVDEYFDHVGIIYYGGGRGNGKMHFLERVRENALAQGITVTHYHHDGSFTIFEPDGTVEECEKREPRAH